MVLAFGDFYNQLYGMVFVLCRIELPYGHHLYLYNPRPYESDHWNVGPKLVRKGGLGSNLTVITNAVNCHV